MSCKTTRVKLDRPFIPPVLAARLATSVLAHTLFLKNQVPLPVMQLKRIPCTNTSPKMVRLCTDLLASFDTLSSHLVSTYAALATALTRGTGKATRMAYLAFVLGPTAGAIPRARVVFAVDALETNVRQDGDEGGRSEESVDNGRVSKDSRSGGSGECGEGNGTDGDGETTEDSETDEDSNPDEDNESDEENELDEDNESDEDSEPDEDSECSDECSDNSECSGEMVDGLNPRVQKILWSPSDKPGNLPSLPSLLHSDDPFSLTEHVLSSTERLLARLLACASEGEGGISSEELAPTQTHVLLLAPRCFEHPAWTPRQNLAGPLDAMLHVFLAALGGTNENEYQRRAGKKVEGVWVECDRRWEQEKGDDCENDGDGEMIWWSWDGKIVGIGDW